MTETTDEKKYDIFRKKFHVPREWENKSDFKDLIDHKYDVSNTKESFEFIEKRLKSLGYMEDNQTMVHDYLNFMLVDILMKNKYIFITEKDLSKNDVLKKLLNDSTPDFVIKKSDRNKKTLIIDIYTGNKDTSSIKSKYRKLEYFSDFKFVTQHNFRIKGIN